MSFLKGTDEGYSIYKKYLAISLDLKRGVPAIVNGKIRSAKCSRETYAASNTLYVFEKIARLLSEEKAEMLFYFYSAIEGNFNIRSFDAKEVEKYSNFIENFSYILETDIKNLLERENIAKLFEGSPTNLTRAVYAKELLPESYLYLSYCIDLPVYDDMVSQSVSKAVKKAEEYLLYFTKKSRDYHVNNAQTIIKKLIIQTQPNKTN